MAKPNPSIKLFIAKNAPTLDSSKTKHLHDELQAIQQSINTIDKAIKDLQTRVSALEPS